MSPHQGRPEWPRLPEEHQRRVTLPGLISQQKHPDNLGFPFPSRHSLLTLNEQCSLRSHCEVPTLDVTTWWLQIAGAVERPVEIGYNELRQMPARTVTALLECSGHSRVFLQQPQVSVRWAQGAVSMADWTGVPLREVLTRAGLQSGAVEGIGVGADQGQCEPSEPKTPGVIPYARSLSLAPATQPEVLLAYQMNGAGRIWPECKEARR